MDTRKSRTESAAARAALAERVQRHGEDVARLRLQVLNMEAVLSQWPALSRFLRTLPRKLKARYPNMVPFTWRCWTGEKDERSLVAAAVAYLRAHPGAEAAGAVRALGLDDRSLRRSRRYRDLRLEQAQMVRTSNRNGPTGGTARALRYLATHRPRSIPEVARAAGVDRAALYRNRRFRAAWNAHLRAAGHPEKALRETPRAPSPDRRGRGDGPGGGARPCRPAPGPLQAGKDEALRKNALYDSRRWRCLSNAVRFGRALGYCEICGVAHGTMSADGDSLILLHCAHLNGDRNDLRPENLAAFCPKCHFLYDELRRVASLAGTNKEMRKWLTGGSREGRAGNAG